MNTGVIIHSYLMDFKFHLLTPTQAIEHAAACGAQCIELVDAEYFLDWPHPKLTTIYETRDLIESLGMTICCFSQYTENEFSIDYRCNEADKIQQIKESILYAHILGSPITRISPVENVDPNKNNVIQECLPFAEKYGVKLGIEIHSPMDPEWVIELVAQNRSEFLGLVPDFSAWWEEGNVSLELFRKCLPYTIHIHAKAQQLAQNGKVIGIPFAELMQILKDIHYSGTIVAEFEPMLDTADDSGDSSNADQPMELFGGQKAIEILVPYIKSFA